jgi:hypothetical protein
MFQRTQQYKGYTIAFNRDLRLWIAYRSLDLGPEFTARTERELKAKIT